MADSGKRNLIAVIACILAAGVVAFVLVVRAKDLPQPEPESPFAHLDDRKAAIYENLRDLQFEYRVGKLSDEDYQNTKKDLQKELAGVLAEVDRLKGRILSGDPVGKPQEGLSGAGAPARGRTPASVPRPEAGREPGGPPHVDKRAEADIFVCPSCGARFESALKFCGECGKPMRAGLV